MYITLLLLGTAASSPLPTHLAARSLVGPIDALPDVDCAIRAAALSFSQALLPWADPSLAFDALRLALDCNATGPPPPPAPPAPPSLGPFDSTFYVDPARGADTNPGTEAAPFLTIGRALAPARAAQGSRGIILRGGTFYLPATLRLDSRDSGLTIAAYPGEAPVLSGGAPLGGLAWAPQPSPSPGPPPPGPPMAGPFQGSILAMGNGGCVDAPGATNPGVCQPLGQLPTAAACAAACLNASTCTGYTWHDATLGSWARWCYARLDGFEGNNHASNHVCGWRAAPPPPPPNVWRATVPAGVAPFDQLFINGRRLVRARWPNANPEVQLSPEGFASAARWLPPRQYGAPAEAHDNGVRAGSRDFPNFQWGTGGTVANFSGGSFWGTRSPPAGAQYNVPSGLVMGEAPAGAPSWTRVRGAIVHAFQGGYWGDWKWNVSAIVNGTVLFEAGGWQEARGGGSGAGYYIENIPELLDAAGEWYFNTDTRELSVAFNGTAAEGNGTLVAPQLAELVSVEGSAGAYVAGLALVGLTFAHTLTDYMLPYIVPSGGDWSCHDGGMVVLRGTVGANVTGCTFSAPGGNGIMISGFNRATRVARTSFTFTGASAIVSAGLGGGREDGGGPDFPEGTVVEGCLGREIGVYVKQSGFFYAGMSANVSLLGNVAFNAARAAVNINDGFA